MSFIWPKLLALLVLVPLLLWGYVALIKRQNRRIAELASQGFVVPAAGRNRRRRHVPAIFTLLGVTLILGAMSRPQATVKIPRREGTVILAFDVSNSMRAKDLEPTRLDAAKTAARAFVKKQPSSVQVGVVAFSDGAITTQRPTVDRVAVINAIDRLKASGGTSLGRGMLASIQAITGKPLLRSDGTPLGDGGDASAAGRPDATSPTTPASPTTPGGATPPQAPAFSAEDVQIGYYGSAAIVLLTDGQNTAELNPVEVAKVASVAGVKVHTIGVGSPEGTVLEINGYKVETALNEDQLKAISSTTNGTYFNAGEGASLTKIYDSIKLAFVSRPEKSEITAMFSAAAMVSLVAGALLSLRWFGRVP